MVSKMIHSDFEYEKGYVVHVARRKYANWDEYVASHRVAERFKKDGQITELRRLWDR